MGDAHPIIEVENKRAARGYVADHVCECGGQFHNPDDESQAAEATSLLGQCALCGIEKRFHFKFTGKEEDDSDFDDLEHYRELPDARPHHYLFGHVVLRQMFLSDPASFLETFPISPFGERRLRQMWQRTGDEMLSPTEEALPPHGLQIRRHMRDEQHFPIVVMPAAIGMAEVVFAALLFTPEDEEPARYLVLEHTSSSGKPGDWGVLCEWFANGSRKNHERHCQLDYAKFLHNLDELLDHELELGGSGKIGLPKWFPDEGKEKAEMLMLDREISRPELCKFAFSEIPRFCAEEFDAFVLAIEQGRGNEFLIEKAQLSGLFNGDDARSMLANVDAELINDETTKAVLVKMPRPLCPPEPALVVILFEFETESLDKAYRATDFYTCELTAPRGGTDWLLGRVDEENHAIIGDLSRPEPDIVLQAAEDHKFRRGRLPCEGNLIAHLMLYATLHNSDHPNPPAEEE